MTSGFLTINPDIVRDLRPEVLGADGRIQVLPAAYWARATKEKPDVVIGCFITHKYDRNQHWRGGNEAGVDEVDLLDRCAAYVLIGNEETHKYSALWKRPNTLNALEYPHYLFSRATNGRREFIATFRGRKR